MTAVDTSASYDIIPVTSGDIAVQANFVTPDEILTLLRTAQLVLFLQKVPTSFREYYSDSVWNQGNSTWYNQDNRCIFRPLS